MENLEMRAGSTRAEVATNLDLVFSTGKASRRLRRSGCVWPGRIATSDLDDLGNVG